MLISEDADIDTARAKERAHSGGFSPFGDKPVGPPFLGVRAMAGLPMAPMPTPIFPQNTPGELSSDPPGVAERTVEPISDKPTAAAEALEGILRTARMTAAERDVLVAARFILRSL